MSNDLSALVADIKAKAEKATPGPWDCFVGNANGRGLVRIETSGDAPAAGVHIASLPRGPQAEANGEYIYAVDPPTVLRLISALETARADVENLRAALKPYAELAIANTTKDGRWRSYCSSVSIGNLIDPGELSRARDVLKETDHAV